MGLAPRQVKSSDEPAAAPKKIPAAGGDLITKYRPSAFEDVIGQDAVVKSLRGVLKRNESHAFFFTGPSGTGKTTLGRLVADFVGCSRQNLIEIDAATNTGIDAMRSVTESMQYSALGGGSKKVYIIDECHMLSKQAWASLLKSIEEPPKHVYWVFCTTDPGKVPTTITARCTQYALKSVSKNLVFDLLTSVAKEEGHDVPEDVLYLIAEKSEGSPRRALAGLAKCCRCKTRREAADLMDVIDGEEEGDVAELCRALTKGTSWSQAMAIVAKLKDQNPESIRHVVCNWMQTVLLGIKDESKAPRILNILEAFSKPYAVTSGVYPIILSLGSVLFDTND